MRLPGPNPPKRRVKLPLAGALRWLGDKAFQFFKSEEAGVVVKAGNRPIRRIILHCSDSVFGDAEKIKGWHQARGWTTIGYHYVVLNGRRKPGTYEKTDDGLIEAGRPVAQMGAHVRGHNADSIGICLIGRGGVYSIRQLRSTVRLVKQLMKRYNLRAADVHTHNEYTQEKTCPDFTPGEIRYFL